MLVNGSLLNSTPLDGSGGGAPPVIAPNDSSVFSFVIESALVDTGAELGKNFLLTKTGEFDFTGGQLQMSRGAVAIAQSLSLRLQAVLLEWFLDTSIGIPMFEEILGVKNPDLVAIRAIYLETIQATPGVTSLLSFSMTLSSTRNLSINFAVGTDFGQLVVTGAQAI